MGSYARNAARPESDVDVILLTTEEALYLHDDAWVAELGLGDLVRAQTFGAITERRHVTASGLEIEIGIGSPIWADTSPGHTSGRHRRRPHPPRPHRTPQRPCGCLLKPSSQPEASPAGGTRGATVVNGPSWRSRGPSTASPVPRGKGGARGR
ncbi:nucleotidyltransferase domain-containing protein [Streptomyces sp. SID14478]|uniref:nucleotidyltransferase domain-containing protein n=1 Tax=Streptomyces sp. SID14478 TaxID=2706073 RepID=UPI0031BAE57C